jgi:non-ribosomal peptide synthetase component F
MIVGILGILKAGAAYVPMDPEDSTDRLSFMMEDANIFLLLTQSQLLDTLPRHNGPRLSLDSDWDVIAKERKTNLARRASTQNLAYVIYTSATTGFLKGVRISHRGLVNYLSWGAEAYEVVKGCGSIVDSSVPFDLAITRVLAPLMVGRSVILVTEDCYINC